MKCAPKVLGTGTKKKNMYTRSVTNRANGWWKFQIHSFRLALFRPPLIFYSISHSRTQQPFSLQSDVEETHGTKWKRKWHPKSLCISQHLNDTVEENAFVQVCKQPLYFCFEISTGETFPQCGYVCIVLRCVFSFYFYFYFSFFCFVSEGSPIEFEYHIHYSLNVQRQERGNAYGAQWK